MLGTDATRLEEAATSASEYEVEIDGFDRDRWDAVVRGFDDAGFHQTWSYGAARWGEPNLSHIVLRRNGQCVAAAQLAVLRAPLLRTGVAYLNWGPLWRPHGGDPDPLVFQRMLAALREHYAERRGLLLRLMPRIFDDEGDAFVSLLESEGFVPRPRLSTYRTLLLDLSLDIDELHRRAHSKFRYNLRRAPQDELQVTPLEGEEGLVVFRRVYNEMQRRKHFVDFSDIGHLEEIQAGLPADLEPSIAACWHRGEPVAVAVTSTMGDTGVSLWHATNEEARRLRAGYVLSWWLVGWLKERGMRWYDLGGLETEGTAGVNVYKASLAGKRGREVRLVGKFDACKRTSSLVTVRLADLMRETYQRARLVRRLVP